MYQRRIRKDARETKNRSPHAVPFSTCEEYTDEEREFLQAVLRLKKKVGPYPTWSDVLAMVRELGYRKRPAAAGAAGEPLTVG